MFRKLEKCSKLDLGTGLWNVGRFWGLLWVGNGGFEEIILYLADMCPESVVSLALGIN